MASKLKTNLMLVGIVAGIVLIMSSAATAFSPGVWSPAHATFYGSTNGAYNFNGSMGGACGYSDMWVDMYGVHTAALSDVLFQDGLLCGACYELQCVDDGHGWCINSGTSVTVTATNNCPLGSTGGWCDALREHFDLSMPAFTTIARQIAGIIPIQYRRVACQKQGGIRFQINGNPFFQTLLIYNVGGAGDIVSMSIKGENTAWLPMKRIWGENWQFGGNLLGQSLSISVTTSDGVTVVSPNVADSSWGYGQTFPGSQFS